MKFNDKYKIASEYQNLFEFKSNEEEIEHEAKMIMFRFISELEKVFHDKPIKKKDLAKFIGTSASFITQLYNGDKITNLYTLAKIQRAYNITFEISAKRNSENYVEELKENYQNIEDNVSSFIDKKFELYDGPLPDYSNENSISMEKQNKLLTIA
jgi:transcriptional regulator with XRE-family HTH domain